MGNYVGKLILAKFKDRCFILKYDRWFFFKYKDVIWFGWKRINEDGQMGGEPINKTTLFKNVTHETGF